MAGIVQPELAGDAVDSAVELLAERVWPATHLGRDFRPLVPLPAQVGQLPLLRVHPSSKFREHVPGHRVPARRRLGAEQVAVAHIARLDPPAIPAYCLLASYLVSE